MTGRARHAAAAAGSVVLGCLAGALVNILTDRWAATVACGLVVTVAGWAALEAWRVLHQPGEGPGVHVDQSVRHVFGRLVGVRGSRAAAVHVKTEVDTVWAGGEVVGVEGDPQSRAATHDD